MKTVWRVAAACLALCMAGLSLWVFSHGANSDTAPVAASVTPSTSPPASTPVLTPGDSTSEPPVPQQEAVPEAVPALPDVKLELYKGPVEHIFFHPLLAYPERAFDGDGMTQGFDDWFVTVKEFKAILDGLYKNNYILIDIGSLYEDKAERGLMLPEGKKPLILSVDDIDYYDYMIRNGTVSRLVVDAQGQIAAVSTDAKHREITSYDNEIVPILDSFVRDHPDFSFKGAKGMLNVTGYEGILGYRTQNLQEKDYEEVKRAAMQVVEALKKDGWSFASHGWGHLDAQKITVERLKQDTKRWKEEVEPLVGPTPVYVFPFGSGVKPGDKKFQALLDAGFHVFCSVGPEPYLKRTRDYVWMDRRHIDGIALRGQVKRLAGLFDAKSVLDPVRPKK
jgi:hypothetical protein